MYYLYLISYHIWGLLVKEKNLISHKRDRFFSQDRLSDLAFTIVDCHVLDSLYYVRLSIHAFKQFRNLCFHQC